MEIHECCVMFVDLRTFAGGNGAQYRLMSDVMRCGGHLTNPSIKLLPASSFSTLSLETVISAGM